MGNERRRLHGVEVMQWGHVSETAERIIIVASGPSLKLVSTSMIEGSDAYIIAINSAINHIKAHAFFTCDPGPNVIPLLQNRRPNCKYYAAVPDDYGTSRAKIKWHRKPPILGITYLRRITGRDPRTPCYGLSEKKTEIHTGNSAYGALGIAYHMRPKKILLLGVDGTADGYAWGEGSPNDLSHLPKLFESAVPHLKARGIKVINGSPNSMVTCFDRMTPIEGLSSMQK